MNDALSLEEARRTRQIRHRQAFDVEQALREKVKELKSVDDCMKDNDMQGQHQTVRNLDKRRLHLEKSIIKHTIRWATIKEEEEMAQKRIQEEGEEDIKEIDNRVLEMRRELNGLKRLNQSYQALYEAKCREVILWHSRLSDVLDLLLCELCMEEKNEAYVEGTPEEILCWKPSNCNFGGCKTVRFILQDK